MTTLNPLNISARLLSEVVWKKLLESSANRLIQRRQSFFELMASLESLRRDAAYDTGSITTGAAWALYSLAHYFAPRRMLEIGTFIGKSTLALAQGADDAGTGVDLHTCDMSNTLELPRVTKCNVRQYAGFSSTAMLTELAGGGRNEGSFQLLYVDGRLQLDDFPLLQRLCAPDVIVALDDFEGIEKGVANLFNFQNQRLAPSSVLIHPCTDELLRQFGFADHSTVALLIPQSLLRFTAQ